MQVVSKFLVNNTVNAVIAGGKGYRKGKSRDYLLNVLGSFLVRENQTIKTGAGEDVEVAVYSAILIKSVRDRIERDEPRGVWRKLVLSLLKQAIREEIGVKI